MYYDLIPSIPRKLKQPKMVQVVHVYGMFSYVDNVVISWASTQRDGNFCGKSVKLMLFFSTPGHGWQTKDKVMMNK